MPRLPRHAWFVASMMSLALSGPVSAAEVDEDFTGLTAPPPTQNVSLAWQLRKRLLKRGDTQRAADKLKEMEELRLDLGSLNLTVFAQALLAEASAAESGARALELAKWAEAWAPDLPDPHFAQARVHLAQGPEVGKLIGQSLKGARKTLTHPLRLAWLTGEVALRAMAALVLTLAVFLAFQWVRYAGVMRHDLGDLLPKGISPRQAGVLLALLAAAPWLTGLPLIASLTVIIAGPFGYQRTGERVVSMIAVAVLATLPWTLPALDRALHWQGGVAESLYRASYDLPSKGLTERLEAAVSTDDSPVWAMHALALIEKRQGKLYKAEERINAALKVASSDHPARPALLINLGVVQLAQNRVANAEATLVAAAKANPQSAAAHFDLAQVRQLRGGDEGQVTRGLDVALTLDEARVEEFQRLQGMGLNRFALDEPIPNSALFAHILKDRPAPTLAGAVLPPLLGGRPAKGLPMIGGGLLLFLLALTVVRGRLRLATQCVKCGGPVCVRCHPDIGRIVHCHDCYLAFHRSERVYPQDRQRQELAVRRRQARERSLSLLLTVVATGAGHLLSGRALRGGAFLFSFFTFLGLAGVWQGILRPIAPASPGLPVVGLTAASIVFLILYVLAILDIRVDEGA